MEPLLSLRKKRNFTQKEVADILRISRQAYSNYEAGTRQPDFDTLLKIADLFNVSVDYLLGNTGARGAGNTVELDHHHIFMIPIYESVAAGFGVLAIDDVTDHTPIYFSCRAEAEETICIKVAGDSMYPKIEDGDMIQVHKQTSVDNGAVAVLLLDGDQGLVKRVIYGPDWIELQSINPMYPPMRFSGDDVSRLRIVGLVKKVIKEI